MTYPFPPDLEKLAKDLMAAGNYASEDDLLRDALTAFHASLHVVPTEDPTVVQGIRRGLEEIERGLGRPYEEFDRDFRAKHHLAHDE